MLPLHILAVRDASYSTVSGTLGQTCKDIKMRQRCCSCPFHIALLVSLNLSERSRERLVSAFHERATAIQRQRQLLAVIASWIIGASNSKRCGVFNPMPHAVRRVDQAGSRRGSGFFQSHLLSSGIIIVVGAID